MSRIKNGITIRRLNRAAATEEGPSGPRTYYGGIVVARFPDITAIDDPNDPRIIAAVNKAFDEVIRKAEHSLVGITGAIPDPDGDLYLIETIDAKTGNLVITWRLPFIPLTEEGDSSRRN